MLPAHCEPLVVVAANATAVSDDPVLHAQARARFEAQQALVLPGLLEPAWLATLQRMLKRAQFELRSVKHVGDQLVETPNLVSRALNLTLGRPLLYRWLEQLTGIAGLQSVNGTVTQLTAGTPQQLHWHDDLNEPAARRSLAISIALFDTAHEGGDFALRERDGRTLIQHHHGVAGTGLIFRVAPGIEHRVTPVLSGGPRTVFAGWFY